MASDEGWQMQRTRKSRRQRAWLAEPDASGGGRKPAQSGGRRLLPEWLRRDETPPPWRAGGKSGGKQANGREGGTKFGPPPRGEIFKETTGRGGPRRWPFAMQSVGSNFGAR